MNEIKNFLSKEECDYLISLIDENNTPSMVVSEGAERDKYDRSRTSSTCNLPVNDAKVKEIHQRIAVTMPANDDLFYFFLGNL